jgi:YidB-like protein
LRTELTEAIRGEATRNPARLAGSDEPERPGGCNSADHLSYYVWQNMLVRTVSGRPQADGDGWVEVPARDMSDRVSHGEDCEPKCKRHTQKADAETWKRRSQHGSAAASKRKPKCAEELGCCPSHDVAIMKNSRNPRAALTLTSPRMHRDELLSGLSQHLPNLVDQLTPEGRLPTEEAASKMA